MTDGVRSSGETGRSEESATARSAESGWWYVLVVTPMVASLVGVVGAAVGTTALVAPAADLSTYAPAYFALGLMTLPLVVLYPLAVYRDATAVARSGVDWSPSPRRYTAAALLSVATAFALSIPLNAYYLRERRRRLDHP